MMYRLALQKSVTVTGISRARHISRVTSDRVWINDIENLILTSITGKKLHHLTDIYSDVGVHTVTRDGELLYIDKSGNINKLSTDNTVNILLIKYTVPWKPQCVYSSLSTGDLLVGMRNTDSKTGKVLRYNSKGENIQTIQFDNSTGQGLYMEPIYITENRNGDVIVSDLDRGVVVTDHGGKHLFTYTGPPPRSGLSPLGICTDALSHILVCDFNTDNIQILNPHGHFLSKISTSELRIYKPESLNYDDKTNLLWVGSFIDNKVNIYRVLHGDSMTIAIPMQIILRGDKSVKNFIENLKKGKTTMYHASGMIIGCAGSGKTTLLERLKGNDVAEIKQKTKSTRGIDIHTDIFDVSDTINVNTSVHKQHFKATFDEIIQIQNVLEHSQKETNEQHIEEQVENKKLVSEKISVKQTSKDNPNPNPGTDLSKNVTLPEKSAEKNEVSPNADKDSISEILRISSSDSDDPEKRITILDFAGQCAYYATHQVFMSPRAFFILVLNMEKKFDDQVGEEECSQTGSIFKKWTHRDYLKFWVKSIHQYSSDKAPVLLIATHAEEKTEEEEAAFFREIWKTLETKDKSLQRHLNVKRQFSVGFHDSDNIEKIKSSIAKIVQEMDHWGKELPRSWAMFENFFQEKKSQRIMHKETLKAFNDALPQEIKLRTVKDINVMLQFFHDIREILNFSQESLNEIIILDVQWFVNAFKNVITDKNHAEEDLFEYASEWENFNKTGELNDTLLTAIWKIKDDGYMKHKKDIMLYMEKLGLVAKLDGLTWYVPCMNKRPFPSNHFKSYPSSSILCYTFHFLPAGIFQRLVTACLQIPWEFASSKSGPFIYQNVAVFLFDNHNILLGMTQTEIQLQVFVIEGKVDTAKCQVIKTEIDKMLNNLSMTFHADLKYQLAFKCKPLGFCNDKESSVIKESDFRGSSFQCLSCPEEKMHFIDKQAITKYWVQMSKYEGECKDFNLDGTHGSRASKDLLATDKSNANIDRIRKLLQVGTDAVRVCFDKFFPKEDLEKTLKDNETNIRRGQFRFQPPQLEILFPTQDGSATGVSSLSMDVTIMYKLLRNFSDIAPPGNGWGKEPRIVDITESDDIERIRLYRNKYSHDPGSRPVISDDVFNIIWTDLSQALIRLSGGVLERRINEI